MTHPHLLLTGFEPFAEHAVNPSWHAAKRLMEELHPLVVARRLPVDFHDARVRLIELLDEFRPHAVLCMGLAKGDAFRIERVARKVSQFDAIDGADAYPSTWTWQSTAAALDRAGVPWHYSDDPGRYVCESTYWTLLDYAARGQSPAECGFLHVPAETELFPVERTIAVVREVVRSYLAEVLGPGNLHGRDESVTTH